MVGGKLVGIAEEEAHKPLVLPQDKFEETRGCPTTKNNVILANKDAREQVVRL